MRPRRVIVKGTDTAGWCHCFSTDWETVGEVGVMKPVAIVELDDGVVETYLAENIQFVVPYETERHLMKLEKK